MLICKTKPELKKALANWRKAGLAIGAVPTMGALHLGHLSLVDTAKNHCDRVIATIFVNPLQFGPREDFATYPRNMERDLELLKGRGCDLVFTPARDELFADNFSTTVSVTEAGENHCAVARPQFFDGVATIVTKLLLIIRPDLAVFGEKDYQQLVVIKRLVRDLDIGVEIIGSPTVREKDGLAMSSRNQYLSERERKIAPAFYHALIDAASRLERERSQWPAIKESAIRSLAGAGFDKVEYINLADAKSLEIVDAPANAARILAAVWLGKTRLIDNVPVGPS